MSDGRDTRAESARARWQRRSREARTPRARLERLVRLSSLSLLVEGLWPRLWLPIGIAMAFASVSWLGLWGALPPLARMAGAGLFLLAFLVSLWPTIRLLASRARAADARAEALARLDRESGLPHRPATSFEDGLAIGADDEGSRALWALHRARAEAEIARLRAPAPRPEMARRDRYALRAAGVLVFAASAFVAGPDLGARLGSAFDWRAPTLAEADFRIDGWIDPPHYTRRPPIMLDLSGGETRLSAPVDSRIVVRIAGRGDATIEPFGGLVADEGEDAPARAAPRPTPVAVGGSAAAAASELREERFVLRSDGELSVRTGLLGGATLVVEAIPDDPPTIAFAGPPESERGGALIVGYSGSDDYGIASAEALVEPPVGLESRRTLVPPPSLPLAPPAPGREEELQSRFDLSDNPWGGAPVRLTLSARDAAGQEGRSETLTLTLPMRPFADPLARALVEQRRNLVLAPDHASRVQTALDALLIAPDIYTPRWGVFLGLNSAATRLRSARSDEDLIAVADFLWEMAVMIEDGDLSQAQRDLMSAAERLQEAMERNADQDEIDRLMQELRAAMDNMLRELAEQMMRNQDAEDLAESLPPDAQVMTRQDLENFLSELENALRNGDMAEAERLMNQLRDMMQNFQTARPDSRMSDPLSREMERQMNELDDLLRGQGDLRDETFRDGQDPGQQQQRRQQQGESGEGDEQSLAERQQALRDRLEALQQRMRELGMQGEEGLDDAEQAMRDAEGALQQGDSGQAVDDQGRAMEGLQRGMQGMAQQMQEMMGDGQGEGEGMGQGMQPGMPGEPGQRGRADARRDDPLGRPSRGRDFSDGDVRIPDADASAAQRARRILEELREKLGDPTRPREELDYFERLLRPN